MDNQGWIKIHRKLLEWEWYDNANVKVLFLHLLLTCNFKEKSWHGITIKPGQIVVGIEKFGKEAGLTHQQTRSALDKLKSTGEITIHGTNNFSILTLNNWDDYQEDNKPVNKRITNEQQTDNKPITTTKECKEGKNEKNITTNVVSTPKERMIKFSEAIKNSTEDYLALAMRLESKYQHLNIPVELDKFISYWTELTLSGKKQRWETEKTFEIEKRLANWLGRAKPSHSVQSSRSVTYQP